VCTEFVLVVFLALLTSKSNFSPASAYFKHCMLSRRGKSCTLIKAVEILSDILEISEKIFELLKFVQSPSNKSVILNKLFKFTSIIELFLFCFACNKIDFVTSESLEFSDLLSIFIILDSSVKICCENRLMLNKSIRRFSNLVILFFMIVYLIVFWKRVF